MALQPAAGARDLNPRQVAINQRLCRTFATVYHLWGYDEVSPPRVERLDTLQAGGAIDASDVVQLVADEPLGLRPEMTASIARAACSRLAGRPRPLRLWCSGTTFRGRRDEGGGQRIEERLQSGVELIGVLGTEADRELLRLLLDAIATIPLVASHRPRLLLGHHAIVTALIDRLPAERRAEAHAVLTGFDALGLSRLDLPGDSARWLASILRLRGDPEHVLPRLRDHLGEHPGVVAVAEIVASIAPRARELGVRLHLDPTFQPHFELYNGLVFQLICQGRSAPVELASGGRYDGVMARFGAGGENAAGVGFSIAVDEIRELLDEPRACGAEAGGPVLVVFHPPTGLEEAFALQRQLHDRGQRSEVHPWPCSSREEAERLCGERGCASVVWAGS
jgi:ATP phosphoribosyltransferase regulatory subunit